MDPAATPIPTMSVTALITIALMIVIGVALWAAGRQVLRPCFAVVGLLLGAALGWAFGVEVRLGTPPWVPALGLALLTGCLGVLLYRLVVTMLLAAVLAAAAPMTVLAVAHWQGVALPGLTAPGAEGQEVAETGDETATDPLTEFFTRDRSAPKEPPGAWERSLDESLDAVESLAPPVLGMNEQTTDRVRAARTNIERGVDAARRAWADTPARVRGPLAISAIIGLLAGLLLGTLLPNGSAVVVTAFGGSILWLSGLHALFVHVGESVAQMLPNSAAATATVWICIALLGIVIQWMFRPRPADKSP